MNLSRHCLLIIILLFFLLTGRTQIKTGSKASQERVFFAFDDHGIPWQHNLKLTLLPAEKHPANPVLRRGPEGAPDHRSAVLYGSVIKIGNKFRMWYLGKTETKFDNGQS